MKLPDENAHRADGNAAIDRYVALRPAGELQASKGDVERTPNDFAPMTGISVRKGNAAPTPTVAPGAVGAGLDYNKSCG